MSNVGLAEMVGHSIGLLDNNLYGRGSATVAIILITIILFVLTRLISPTLDPKEPPLLKSRIPVIGHIIGIIRLQTSYHKFLR